MIATGILYIVATPIGNLKDITLRALDTLREVDLIAAEDTRHSKRLLQEYDINTPLISLHEHNEHSVLNLFLSHLDAGRKIALISDAGTPLICDPGFPLVRAARLAGFAVVPIPGACAAIAALSASGIAADHFVFEGFLPNASNARSKRLERFLEESRTVIFYEAVHRIVESLTDMVRVLGSERRIVLAREMTKTYETFLDGTLSEVLNLVMNDSQQQRGEFVLILEGCQITALDDALPKEAKRILSLLLAELSVKQASQLAADITGCRKNALYDYALNLGKKESE
ncbi:MAG: 16S rRNA (cytidine(1402)-2'-O)-methyltransferase [Legionellales bacterium]|nr:16S rRNA (cytidine(1402)-2'-O)-methyltransferase [Legionellales bacterium]